ncbi:hypothetical protein H0H92_001971 [Tricholoma furcatifolium]|nr:hypothetical protein H0H92_001971 [Tricholoma furcatifolium]
MYAASLPSTPPALGSIPDHDRDVEMASIDAPALQKAAESGPKAEEQGLPFPRKRADGSLGMEYRCIENQARTVLASMCREYKIPYSRAVVQELKRRLTEFSLLGEDEWARALSAGKRHSHRGPCEGSKNALLKQSYKRQLEIFSAAGGASTGVSRATATAFNRSEEDKAKTFVETHPYIDPDEAERALNSSKVHTGCEDRSIKQLFTRPEQSISELKTSVVELSQAMGALSSSGSTFLPLAPAAATQPQPPPQSSPTLISPSLLEENPPQATANPAPATRSIQLGSGVLLRFSKEDVPEPPATSFAKDIERLNEMWDDISPHWRGKSDLVILGHYISLVHWRDVYRYWLPHYWASIKTRWSEWRLVITYYRKFMPDARQAIFFDEHGKLQSWRRIHGACSDRHQEEDRELARLAKEEYGDEFSSLFTYRRGSAHGLEVDKISSIAKRYRKMKGIPDLLG